MEREDFLSSGGCSSPETESVEGLVLPSQGHVPEPWWGGRHPRIPALRIEAGPLPSAIDTHDKFGHGASEEICMTEQTQRLLRGQRLLGQLRELERGNALALLGRRTPRESGRCPADLGSSSSTCISVLLSAQRAA